MNETAEPQPIETFTMDKVPLKYVKKYLKCSKREAEIIVQKFEGKTFHKLKVFLKQLKDEKIKEGLSSLNQRSRF